MGWVIDIYLYDTAIYSDDTNTFESFSQSDTTKGFNWIRYNLQRNYYFYYAFIFSWETDQQGEYGYPKLSFAFDALAQTGISTTYKLGVNVTDLYSLLDTDMNWNGEITPQFSPLVDGTFNHDGVQPPRYSIMTLEPPVPSIEYLSVFINFHPVNFSFSMVSPPVTNGEFRTAIYSLQNKQPNEDTIMEQLNCIRSRYGDGIPKPPLFEKK